MKNSRRDPKPLTFEGWLKAELTNRGYDVSGLRSGGRTAFAADSGISPATVGRLLRGEQVTDIRIYRMLAEALDIPLGTILIRSGLFGKEELQAIQAPPPQGERITPEQAAEGLGIADDQDRHLFVTMARALQRKPPTNGEENLAAN